MTYTDTSKEKREFFRIKFQEPLQFKSYQVNPQNIKISTPEASRGTAQNISVSGLLFQTPQEPPRISSILWMNLDMRTLRICREIEDRALILNNGVLAKVVRVEEDTNNRAYDVGVCFLTQDQKDSAELQSILTDISKAS